MLPLLKKSTDNLVAVMGEMVASKESFDDIKYVHFDQVFTKRMQLISIVFRVFGSFTMETILATAFGRRVNIQRGESDELSKAMELLMAGFTDGQVEQLILIESEPLIVMSVFVLNWPWGWGAEGLQILSHVIPKGNIFHYTGAYIQCVSALR